MRDYAALPPAADFAVAPGAAAAGQEQDNPFEIFERIHRLLRGRYVYAIVLGAIGAAVGAAGGWMATKPKYQSVGMIRIKEPASLVYTIDDHRNRGSGYLRTIAQLIQEPRVIDRAMTSDAWKRVGKGFTPDARDEFRDSLRVETDPGATELIYVRFTDPVPSVAKVGVEQVISAYEIIHGDTDLVITPQRIADLQTGVRTYDSRIGNLRQQIVAIGKDYGATDLEPLYTEAFESLREKEKELTAMERQIARAELAPEASETAVEPDEPAIMRAAAKIAKDDPTIADLIKRMNDAQSYVTLLRDRGLTDVHPGVVKAEATAKGLRGQVLSATKKYMDQQGGVTIGPDGEAVRPSPERLAQMKAALETARRERDTIQDRVLTLNAKRLQIADLNDQIKKEQASKAEVEKRLTQLTTESNNPEGGGRITIISKGEEPNRPSVDSRKKLAALGFMLGGGIPVGLVLLWGLLDRRFRFSDDASAGPIQPALLGILPYLPEDMADPEQAAVAAHCVHQIRTLLQISAAQHDRRVFVVTSPTSGDGKTSLSLSLALSFASSGSNTCLIDFDLIGRGLTSAMNAKSEEGVMDAIDRGELNGHIKATGFKRLSIVPAGNSDAQHVPRLSPVTVQHLVRQAREKFDVVVIDTGPILGSIEASLVASASDGVILALGRGQARPLAERAIQRLASVGSSIVGVVFNRAQPNDFRRAISSASVRSVPNQGGAPPEVPTLPAMGPMARTVASQVGPSNPPPDAY